MSQPEEEWGHLRVKVLAPLLIAIGAVLVTFLIFAWLSGREELSNSGRWRADSARRTLFQRIAAEANTLEIAAHMVVDTPGVTTSFVARSVDDLYRAAEPVYRSLGVYGVTHLYFLNPDRTVLLRVHRPEERGDAVDRWTATTAVAQRERVWGVESGSAGQLTLRVVVPQFSNDGRLIGFIELGQEIGHLVDRAAEAFDVGLAVMVPKNILDRPRWEVGVRELGHEPQWDAYDNVVAITVSGLDGATRKALARWIADGEEGFRVTVDDRIWAMGEFDLPYTASGVATVFVFRDITVEDRALLWRIGSVAIGLGGVLALLGFFFSRRLGRIDEELAAAQRVLSTSKQNLERMVRERTDQLSSANARLEEEVAERIDIELRLRDIRANLEEAQRIARLGSWEWSLEKETLWWSDEIYRIFGETADRFVVSYEKFIDRIAPDDRFRVQEGVRRAMASEAPYDLEHRIVLPDGAIRHVRERAEVRFSADGRPIGMIGTVQDVTELVEARTRLKESEQRFRELSLAALEGIVMHDGGKIIDANRAFANLAGVAEERLAGRSLLEFVHSDDVDRAIRLIEAEGEKPERIRAVNASGEERIVEVTGRSAPYHGAIVRMTAVRDITEAVAFERRAEEQRRMLAQADRLRSLGTLVAGVAHEINNPTSFVMFNAPLIDKAWRSVVPLLDERAEAGAFTLAGLPYERVKEDVPRFVENILTGARRIQAIVDNLKDFARHSPPGETTRFDINEAVTKALELMTPLLAKTGRRVDLVLAEDLPPVEAGRSEIEQVVINLLSNAVQALEATEAGVRVVTRRRRKEKMVDVAVIDEGCGIAKEDLEKIVDPFYTTKRGEGGTGLGLTISYGIARDYGGTLTIDSTPGKGTIATLTLPEATQVVHGT
jgi:PAS domain S-box-containing protein